MTVQPQQEFIETVWDYYHDNSRDLPWRQAGPDSTFDAYKILVSEVMLQQTQVARVIAKYQEFLASFPTVSDLAQAPLADVLRAWQGLGYNRRAKFLWQAAQMVTAQFDGVFPKDQKDLVSLPGVGVNTAGAICAYAFNQPVVFIETNIRTVYIHHFFADRDDVHDKELIPLVVDTVDQHNPREWYWALMDYGSHLKASVGNISRSSKHYAKQSKFEGSKRQIRGQVLRLLAEGEQARKKLLVEVVDPRLPVVLEDLQQEGLIQLVSDTYRLSSGK